MAERVANADDRESSNFVAQSLLVNFFEAHNVGHVMEALHYCLGHHKAKP